MRARRWGLVGLVGVGGCCSGGEPAWRALPPLTLAAGGDAVLDLSGYVDAGPEATFRAEPATGLATGVDGTLLAVAADPGFDGTTYVEVVGVGRCGDESRSTLVVTVEPAPPPSCPTEIRYVARTAVDQVFLAGDFNGWSPVATPMTHDLDADAWVATLELPVGPHAYKVVETTGTAQQWACDPESEGFQCDAGAVFDAACPPGGAGCNSLVLVEDCTRAILTVSSVAIDRDADTLAVEVEVSGEPIGPRATLDGEPIADAWTGTGFSVALTGLEDRRYDLVFTADNAESVHVPAWLDDRTWETGLMYFPFVDRFANGDPSNDDPVGATAVGGDYAGGDWSGLTARLPYLDELGVTALWLTAPWDNPDTAWSGDCGVTYSGYHGYWPSSDTALEPHFGDEAALDALIDAAHARGIRVLLDLVANHVHEEHPWVTEHPEWFTEAYICSADEDGNGVQNWDQRPETCWFTGYLPDLDYSRAEVIDATSAAAIAAAKAHRFDGFRIDAVKHLSHGWHATLQARIARELEHRDAGGDEPFYTVGETFTGDRGLIASYVGPAELDGQFDFPLYWGILGAFARDEIGLSDGVGSLSDVAASSRASFDGHLMSTFLGNHDVARFVAHANGEIASLYGDGTCAPDGSLRPPDAPPETSGPYDRLRLAWSFLLTWPGLPLIYYGDEIGLPGHADPDNRQEMRFAPELSPEEEAVLAHVRALGTARRAHPAFAVGETVGWWENEPDLWAYARVWDGDAVLVVLNRGAAERTLTNGLAFAGLPSGRWVDVATGEIFPAADDSLTVTVGPTSSRVLVPE